MRHKVRREDSFGEPLLGLAFDEDQNPLHRLWAPAEDVLLPKLAQRELRHPALDLRSL